MGFSLAAAGFEMEASPAAAAADAMTGDWVVGLNKARPGATALCTRAAASAGEAVLRRRAGRAAALRKGRAVRSATNWRRNLARRRRSREGGEGENGRKRNGG